MKKTMFLAALFVAGVASAQTPKTVEGRLFPRTSTAGPFTAGSVPYIGSTGAISQDNANLFWDSSSLRLGIGTATPSQLLEVKAPPATEAYAQISSQATNKDASLRFFDGTTTTGVGMFGSGSGGGVAGRVGLINTNVGLSLDNAGQVGIPSPIGGFKLGISDTTDVYARIASNGTGKSAAWSSSDGSNQIFFGLLGGDGCGTTGSFCVYLSGVKFVVTTGGDVGIGDTTPDAHLDVQGTQDEIQMQVTGVGGQTADLVRVETSAAVAKLTVAASGVTTADSAQIGTGVSGDPGWFKATATGTDACDTACGTAPTGFTSGTTACEHAWELTGPSSINCNDTTSVNKSCLCVGIR